MKREIFVLASNELVGQVVESVFNTELDSRRWNIVGVYKEALNAFTPAHGSVLVIDRRLGDYMAEHYVQWCDRATYLVPFDEMDFDNIHECFRDLLSYGFFHSVQHVAEQPGA